MRVQAVGRRVSTPSFVFLVAAERERKSCPSRLGLVVTKKVGSAVVRNRIKRLCRECFRLWPDFVPPGIDLVVIARAGAPALDFPAVRAEWERARPAVLQRSSALLGATAASP